VDEIEVVKGAPVLALDEVRRRIRESAGRRQFEQAENDLAFA
jgi:hypothetical protein